MIVDFDFYQQEWKGEVPEDEFGKFEIRSEDVLNALTRGGLDVFDTFDERKKKLVKKAICAQVDYYNEQGINVGMERENSFTVGKVSVSESNGADGSKINKMYCPLAIMFLEQCGLMSRVVSFC